MAKHHISRADILPDREFAKIRAARRAELLPVKRLRRIALGPVATVHFECYDSMLFQIQEMLLIEKGGESQIDDELQAYSPLVPKGRELVATIMFEIDEPVRRAAFLARLGGVEDCFILEVGGDRSRGIPEGDVERTREDGKASSIHFIRFGLTPEQIARFRDPQTRILVGCDHEAYSHLAMLSPATRTELCRDFDPPE